MCIYSFLYSSLGIVRIVMYNEDVVIHKLRKARSLSRIKEVILIKVSYFEALQFSLQRVIFYVIYA